MRVTAEGTVARFGGGVVEVWRTPVGRLHDRDTVLSDEERARAARLRRPADQDRFTTAWLLVRHTLADRLGTGPGELRFRRTCRTCGRTGHGKPALLDGGRWEFSLSHAGGYVLLAVSDAGPVGVDLEAAGEHLSTVASMVCAPSERAGTAQEVLSLWVRKEAVLKATGDGLAVPMSGFTVDPLTWPADPSVAERMALADPGAPSGYRAAVAVLPDRPAAGLHFDR